MIFNVVLGHVFVQTAIIELYKDNLSSAPRARYIAYMNHAHYTV